MGLRRSYLAPLAQRLLRSDLAYDLLMTRSLDLVRTRMTLKATRIQLMEIRRRLGTGVSLYTLPGGLRMEFDLSDDLDAFMYDHLSRFGSYEPEVEAALSSVVTPTTTFVDVGANVGYFTLLFARSARRVYALEPVGPVFGRLERNVRINALKNVVAMNVAASRARGAVRLFESRISAGHDSTVKRSEHDGYTTVEAVALDDVVEPGGDVVMKVDVEGSEMDVLLGARRLLASGSVSAVVLEWARGLYPEVANLRERFALYASLGSVELLAEGAAPRRATDRGELPEICNLLVRVRATRGQGHPQRL